MSGRNHLLTEHPARPLTRHGIRPWRVLHACAHALPFRELIRAEWELGMRPVTATATGTLDYNELLRLQEPEEARSLSLLTAWAEVRSWRRRLTDSPAAVDCELVHAHDFSSGMAAVRNCPVTVYDIDEFIDDLASTPGSNGRNSDPHHWLTRSFRVAEQFVTSRAAAVVTRTESARQMAITRGADPVHTFVVPGVLNFDAADGEYRREEARRQFRLREASIVFICGWNAQALGADFDALTVDLMQSCAALAAGQPAEILIEAQELAWPLVREKSIELGIGDRVHLVAAPDAGRALAASDFVIAGPWHGAGTTPTVHPLAEAAMYSGRALLAADLPCHRDLTPDGRGALWFAWKDFRDFTHRTLFLARNPEFRIALGEAGKQFLFETRSPEKVALRYDEIYSHAARRRSSGGLQTPVLGWVPAQGCA